MPQEHRTIQLRLVKVTSQTALERCFEMFLLHLEASQRTPRTIEYYREVLSRFLEFLAGRGVSDPEGVTADGIRRYLVHLQDQGLKDSTVHKHARGVKAFCNFLEREELVGVSPMRKVAMPTVTQEIHPPYSPEEIQKLLKACTGPTALRDKAMILCLLDSGLRAAEFVSLNVGDIERDGLVKVLGKGQKERYVRLGARARKAMLRYLAERGETHPDEPLWLGRFGRLTVSGLAQALRRIGERAGVHCYAHKFRRTFAVWALKGGMDVHHLRAIMGHADLQMAQRYLALVKDDIAEAHRQASPVDNFLGKRKRR